MTPGLLVRQTLRESRGGLGRLAFSIACLAIGVAAVVAIAALSSSFENGIRSNAKEMLGADLVVRSNKPLPAGWTAPLAAISAAHWIYAREQPQVIQAGEGAQVRSLLAELMVVDPEYPFYGTLALDSGGTLADVLRDDTAVIVPDAAARLDLRAGDTLRVGGLSLRIAAVAKNEPDRITGVLYIGPRVYLTPGAFAKAGLSDITTGVRYRVLVRLPEMMPEQLEAVKTDLEKALEAEQSARVETYIEGRPTLQRGLEDLSRFLGMIALLSLLLGGVGVAQAVRAWIAGRMDAIAVLKCIGMRPREILVLYAAQATLLGLVGSAAGAALGLGLTALLPIVFRTYIPANLIHAWQPRAALGGLSLGVAVAIVFSLPPLIAVLRVAPVRVFRRNAEPLPGARWVSVGTAIVTGVGIAALAGLQARSVLVGTIFTAGVLTTALVLATGAWVLMKCASKIPRDWGHRVWLRYGLAALSRPGANTIPSIVSLGLGLLVLFSASVVQDFFNQQLTGAIPKKLPSAIVLNARPDQVEGLKDLLEAERAEDIVVFPLVMARMTAVDDKPLHDDSFNREDRDPGRPRDRSPRGRRGRAGREERPLTYLKELPAANKVVAGELWSRPDVAEASLEKDWAQRLGLGLGSKLTFAVTGRTVDFVVTSLREVNWKEMGINFEIIAEPGYLDDAPQFRIATVRLPKGEAAAVQNRVTAAYPNLTFVPIGDVVERIAAQLTRISWGVRMLGLFIVGAAIAVLAGTIGIESIRRGREVALLKTLGMTRREVVGVFAAEYALIGLVAGIIGVTGGGIVAWVTVVRALDVEFHWPFGMFAIAIFAGMAVAVVAGITASVGALRRRPIEMLRHQE